MEQNKTKPLVSLITVNYNGIGYLKDLFTSLRKVTYSPLEIIMVDNASADESVEYTRRNFPEVRIVRNDRNYMFARGNNEGIKIAAGEIICLINNDVIVEPGFLEPVVEKFISNPEMAAGQPKVLDMNRPDYFEYAGAAGGFLDKYGYPFLRGRLFFTLEKDEAQYDSEIEIFWASGACFFIRKSVLDEVGLLDEDFILHMEEIDLCWRMHLHGKKIYYVSAARVWHKGGGTMAAENPRKVFWNYRNNIFLLVKNLSFLNLVRMLSARLFLDAAAFAGEMMRGKAKSAFAIIQAYGWVVSHIPLIVRKRRLTQQNRLSGDDFIFKLIYPGSIVWEYFGRGRKEFNQLKKQNYLAKEL